MTIAILTTGRLKNKPRCVDGKITAMMIATDGSNRAQRINIESTSDETSKAIRELQPGDMLTVSGEVVFGPMTAVYVKARRVESLVEIAQPVAQSE